MPVGQALAAARTRAGLTLDDVAERTKIRRTLVALMEADDFSRSGGDFYARAHIRSVARAVGADAAPLLADYDAAYGAGSPSGPGAPVLPALPMSGSDAAFRSQRRGPNWTAAMAAALVLVVAVIVGQAVRGEGTGAGSVTTLAGVVPSPGAAPRATKPARPAPTDAVAAAPRSGVTVVVTAVGSSWLSSTGGTGRQLFQGTFAKGSVKTFRDPKRVRLIVGNAAAVTLVVNGKPIGMPGGRGDVARLSFTPGDPAAS